MNGRKAYDNQKYEKGSLIQNLDNIFSWSREGNFHLEEAFLKGFFKGNSLNFHMGDETTYKI